jgi:hypothetical protein
VFNRDVHDNPRLIDDILWISVTAELSIDIANVTWAFKGNDTYAVTYTPLTTGAVIVVRSVVMLCCKYLCCLCQEPSRWLFKCMGSAYLGHRFIPLCFETVSYSSTMTCWHATHEGAEKSLFQHNQVFSKELVDYQGD